MQTANTAKKNDKNNSLFVQSVTLLPRPTQTALIFFVDS